MGESKNEFKFLLLCISGHPEIDYDLIYTRSTRLPTAIILMIIAVTLVMAGIFLGGGIVKCFVILKEYLRNKKELTDESSQTGFEPAMQNQSNEIRRFNAVTEFPSANENQTMSLPPSYNEVMNNCFDFDSAPPTYLESLKIEIPYGYQK